MKELSNFDFVAKSKLEEKRKVLDKCCGYSRGRNDYRYPEIIFCFANSYDNENPVRSIFDTCSEWAVKEQDCFCVEDAPKALHSRNRIGKTDGGVRIIADIAGAVETSER